MKYVSLVPPVGFSTLDILLISFTLVCRQACPRDVYILSESVTDWMTTHKLFESTAVWQWGVSPVPVPVPVPVPQSVWSSRAADRWMFAESVQYGNILKVYRCMPKSEVACPKKDSITASNWGRFLPVLQIKSPLKLVVLDGFRPHPPSTPTKPPPSLSNTQTPPHISPVKLWSRLNESCSATS